MIKLTRVALHDRTDCLEESCILDQWLLQMVRVMLRKIQCSFRGDFRPGFGELCILFAAEYLPLLSFSQSAPRVEDDDGNGQYVDLRLDDKPLRDSRL